jgi:multiple sugar transport system permease protein
VRNRLFRREAFWAYLFITPFLGGLGVFFIYAFIENFYTGFTNRQFFGRGKFIGFANYVRLMNDGLFRISLLNTLKYVVICVPVVIILSILIASLLNTGLKTSGLYRTLLFIPAVTMPAAIALVWRWVLNYEFGVVNTVLKAFGSKPVAWLSDPRFSLYSVSLVLVWTAISTHMVIFLVGLQNIPAVYYEAAKIDGAGPFTRFFRITIPLLSPTIFFCLTMETIGVFQIFDLIYLMIPRGSSGMPAARSIIWLFYDEAFYKSNRGYASAITVVLFLIILFITVFQMLGRRRWVYEE